MENTGTNEGVLKLYADGNKVWEGWFSFGTPDTMNTPFAIGRVFGDNGYNFEGYVAEIKVWDKILTDEEVLVEYNRVLSLKQG